MAYYNEVYQLNIFFCLETSCGLLKYVRLLVNIAINVSRLGKGILRIFPNVLNFSSLVFFGIKLQKWNKCYIQPCNLYSAQLTK